MKRLLLLLLPYSLAAQTIGNMGNAFTSAQAFKQSLSLLQKEKAVFLIEDLTRYEWHYVPATQVTRRGIAVKDLETVQKKHLYEMMAVFLSEKGMNRTREIMNYEYLLKELEPNNPHRIPENYFVSLFGQPHPDSIWAWRFTGHHLALNFTVVKNKLAFAPFFFGANPAEVKEGPKKGARILREEEALGFELIHSLSHEQKKQAIFQQHAFSDIVTTNAHQVSALEPVGILAKHLNAQQQMLLTKIINTYLANMAADVAAKRRKKLAEEDQEALRFGWAGELVDGRPHYYRIQGKTFIIEFDNTQNNANHIHVVWRDFKGDYGRDLLKEHYQNDHQH